MIWEQLTKLLRGHKVYIQTHNFPDPDALASGFALKVFLESFDIPTILCYDGAIDKLSTKRMVELFQIDVVAYEDIRDMEETDYIITVDGQKYNTNLTDLPGDEVACIDHHPVFVDYKYAYQDIRMVGACSTILAHYYYESGITMPQDVASALLYGLKIDTNNLSRGVTDLDIDMFAYLYKLADIDKVNKMYTNIIELKDLRAFGAAIESIKVFDLAGFACIPFECPDALIGMVSDFILSLDEVSVAVVYAYRDGGLKFSVRSCEEVYNAGQITAQALKQYGNGGGHVTMAGGYIGKDAFKSIGRYYEFELQNRFLKAMEQARKKAKEKQE